MLFTSGIISKEREDAKRVVPAWHFIMKKFSHEKSMAYFLTSLATYQYMTDKWLKNERQVKFF